MSGAVKSNDWLANWITTLIDRGVLPAGLSIPAVIDAASTYGAHSPHVEHMPASAARREIKALSKMADTLAERLAAMHDEVRSAMLVAGYRTGQPYSTPAGDAVEALGALMQSLRHAEAVVAEWPKARKGAKGMGQARRRAVLAADLAEIIEAASGIASAGREGAVTALLDLVLLMHGEDAARRDLIAQTALAKRRHVQKAHI